MIRLAIALVAVSLAGCGGQHDRQVRADRDFRSCTARAGDDISAYNRCVTESNREGGWTP